MSSNKRKSVTEPIEDNVVFSEASLREESFSEESCTNIVDTERILTAEERKTELYLILLGIKTRKESLLSDAEAQVSNIQKELEIKLQELNSLEQVYSAEYKTLVKGDSI